MAPPSWVETCLASDRLSKITLVRSAAPAKESGMIMWGHARPWIDFAATLLRVCMCVRMYFRTLSSAIRAYLLGPSQCLGGAVSAFLTHNFFSCLPLPSHSLFSPAKIWEKARSSRAGWKLQLPHSGGKFSNSQSSSGYFEGLFFPGKLLLACLRLKARTNKTFRCRLLSYSIRASRGWIIQSLLGFGSSLLLSSAFSLAACACNGAYACQQKKLYVCLPARVSPAECVTDILISVLPAATYTNYVSIILRLSEIRQRLGWRLQVCTNN